MQQPCLIKGTRDKEYKKTPKKQTQQPSCSHDGMINNNTKTEKTRKNMIPTSCPPTQILTQTNQASSFPPH